MAVSIDPDSKILGVLDFLYNTLVKPQEYQTPVFDTGQTQQFADTHNAMLPERGSRQSMLLPFGYDAQGNIEPAIPSLVRDVGLGAFGLLGEYEKAQTGTGYQDVRDITPQEAANSMQGLLEVMTGGLIDNAPKSVRSGLSRSGDRELLTNDLDDLGFYSPTERLATTLQPKGTGQQYLGILSKGDGKGSRIQEEMADMGLDTWLKGKGKVSRDEVLDYIGENRLRYSEEVLSDNAVHDLKVKATVDRTIDEMELIIENDYQLYQQSDEIKPYIERYRQSLGQDGEAREYLDSYFASAGYSGNSIDRHTQMLERRYMDNMAHERLEGAPKYRSYAQEGGTGYQENLLTVPDPERVKFDALQAERDKLSRMNLMDNYEGSGKSILDRIAEIDKEVGYEFKGAKQYNSPHYDPANIGLTTRTQSFNTPQGDSVHLMDELQSDWHK